MPFLRRSEQSRVMNEYKKLCGDEGQTQIYFIFQNTLHLAILQV